jgi:topoisomerase-4 subunit B
LFNGEKYLWKWVDLLEETISTEDLEYNYPLEREDIKLHIVKHQYSEEYHSFVNGQNTTQDTFSCLSKQLVIREFYNKSFEHLMFESLSLHKV